MTPKRTLADLPYWPRLLSVEQAARYVGLSVRSFQKRVGELWPQPIRIGGRIVFDRLALDSAVDALSLSPSKSPPKKIFGEAQHGNDPVEAR